MSVQPIVLYIAGVGRSGSTLLDTVLGTDPACEGLGELSKLVDRGVFGENLCACGLPVPDCPFWREVLKLWQPLTRDRDLRAYVHCQRGAEALFHLQRRTRLIQAYAEATTALFACIQQVSGRTVLVDSSKSPGRALALARTGTIDIRVLHLVRDPRAVALSMGKAIRKDAARGADRATEPVSAERAAVNWVSQNVQTEYVLWRAFRGRYVRLYYEEFLRDPAATLAPVGKLIDVDLGRIASAAAQGVRLDPRHKVAGNRLRLSGNITLDRGMATLSATAPRHTAADLLTAPLRRRYGY